MDRRIAVTSQALLLVAGLIPATARAQGAARWSFAGVSFPSVVDTFVNNDAYRWVNAPRLGMSLNYVIPGDRGTELTLYIYPVRDDDSLGARGDGRDERDQVTAEIERNSLKDRGMDEFRITASGTLALGGQTGAHAIYLVRYGEDRVTSLLYVFVKDGMYYKLRASFAEDEEGEMLAHVRTFMQRALAEVRREP